MKKALIVSPYLDQLGGGERYLLQAAASIEAKGYTLYFAWEKLAQITRLTKLLGIKLQSPQLDTTILPHYHSHNPLAMWRATRNYDLVFYLSDGSIPLLGGRQNYLHIQVPFHHVGGRSPLTQLKLSFIAQIIVNSQFTKSHIDQEFAFDSAVVYPPIQSIKAVKKDKLILSVGRFEPSLNVKRQDLLIKAFCNLKLKNWRLALVGGSSDDQWLQTLKRMAGKSAVEFYPNLSYQKLTDLYARASIYWHAAGYQIDAAKHPDLCEHFGITTAEAVSAGCIPLVVPKGGQTEVVPDSSYHWQEVDQLLAKTKLAANGKLASPLLPSYLAAPPFAKQLTAALSL